LVRSGFANRILQQKGGVEMWWGRMENLFKKYSAESEEASGPDKPCKGKHRDHVCAMAARADFQKVSEVAGQPKYVCMNCGRVADVADNLCNPIAMSSIASELMNAA
jgi:hypothetical protein